jgi:predicted deacylase
MAAARVRKTKTVARSSRRSAQPPLRVGGKLVKRGQRRRLELPVARLPTGTALSLPVTVLRGRHPGPTVWLSGAVHGDEVNGTEIVRQVVKEIDPKSLNGSVIAVPIVNVYGFIERSRYLPDRRDLNRSFPGSPTGSLASRLADLFLREVVSLCTYGIDFHTGARHRTNLAHLRADLNNPEALKLASAFGAPIVYNAGRIVGSLRAEAHRRKIPILVFEGGEPLRFAADVIEIGVQGTLRVLEALGMWKSSSVPPAEPSREAKVTRWLRAGRSGILGLETSLGQGVQKGEILARIADPFSGRRRIVRAPFSGLVFSQTTNPLVYQGDAILRLAKLAKPRS